MFAMRKMPWRILFAISKTHQEKRENKEMKLQKEDFALKQIKDT